MSIDELTDSLYRQEQPEAGLEEKVGKPASFWTWPVKYLAPTALIGVAAYALSGIGAFLTSGAYGIGYIIESAKLKEKVTVKKFFQNIWKGMVLGVLGYSIYAGTETIARTYDLGRTFGGKLLKTAIFNPLGIGIFNLGFQAYTHAEEKHGWNNMLKPWTWPKFAYTFVRDELPRWPSLTANVGAMFFPIHFLSQNYVSNVYSRMAIGGGLDVAYRLIAPAKKKPEPNPAMESMRRFNSPAFQYS